MPIIVYMDEAGDHSLAAVDQGFPIFALALFICDTKAYIESIIPAVYRLKFDYFGHEAVILHSREIRKGQGDFAFLTEKKIRKAFYDRLNMLMNDATFSLIVSVIRKQAHKDQYGLSAENPYDLALTFALERLLPLLEHAGQKEVCIVAEARGKREDRELELTFLRTVMEGTGYVSGERFRKVRFNLVFKPKSWNIVGTQMADLVAYPTARHVLNPRRENLAWNAIQGKFYCGLGNVRGLKVFPTP